MVNQGVHGESWSIKVNQGGMMIGLPKVGNHVGVDDLNRGNEFSPNPGQKSQSGFAAMISNSQSNGYKMPQLVDKSGNATNNATNEMPSKGMPGLPSLQRHQQQRYPNGAG